MSNPGIQKKRASNAQPSEMMTRTVHKRMDNDKEISRNRAERGENKTTEGRERDPGGLWGNAATNTSSLQTRLSLNLFTRPKSTARNGAAKTKRGKR